MAQYKSGNVSVVNGDATVTGTGTLWTANVTPGDGFTVAGTGVPYTVASVTNDTSLELSAPYAGASGSGLAYTIWRDFETNTGAPEMSQGDIETATIFTRALRRIGQTLSGIIPTHVAESDPHPQYETKDDVSDRLTREALLAEATLSLDYANNKYEVYEGPVNGLTAKPFNEIHTFTRSSGASARNAIGGLSPVLTDQQRLVGNREGLLIEEQRTNLLLWSEAFDNAGVVKENLTIAANVAVAPDGNLTADKMVSSTTNTNQNLRYFRQGDGESWSLYAKYDGIQYICFSYFNNSGANAVFDLVNGTISDPPLISGWSAEITPVGNGWYRCVVNVLGTGHTFCRISLNDTGDGGGSSTPPALTTGDGVKGIFIWGAQEELGSFPTSYIKTEGSQVTRSADNASVDTLTPWFNQVAGTWYCDFVYDFSEDFRAILGSNLSAFSPIFVNDPSSSGLGYDLRDVGGATFSTGEPLVIRQRYKVAVSVDSSGAVTFTMDGVTKTDNQGTALDFSSVSAFELFKRGTIADIATGRLLNFRYTPRKLSATELESLTS